MHTHAATRRHAAATALSLFTLVPHAATHAQGVPPAPTASDRVRWTIAATAAAGRHDVVLTATIERGWHVYSLTQRDDGPLPLRITLQGDSTVQAAGLVRGPAPQRFPTSPFGIPVEWYTNTARFTLPVRVTASHRPNPTARVAIRFQACSESLCLPPKTLELTQPLTPRSAVPPRGAIDAPSAH